MIIYGAGMAGLLAANMLRRYQPVVHEAQPSLPNNHEALLRFRTDVVSRATGIPFRRVEVTKAIYYKSQLLNRPDINTNNLYSFKATGEYRDHSIKDLRPVERFIAPPDFIEQLASGCTVKYDSPLESADIALWDGGRNNEPVISTIPMPTLMDMTAWESTMEFNYKTIWSVWVTIDTPRVDLYQTIYFPDPDVPYYRISITGNRVIVEFGADPARWTKDPSSFVLYLYAVLANCFGLPRCTIETPAVKEQRYGKLLPTDDMERCRFILAMTDQYRIYSLGRFATWRQVLMDDVVQDVQRIERWIMERSSYLRRLQS